MFCVVCKQELEKNSWFDDYYRCPKCFKIMRGCCSNAEKIKGLPRHIGGSPHEQ